MDKQFCLTLTNDKTLIVFAKSAEDAKVFADTSGFKVKSIEEV